MERDRETGKLLGRRIFVRPVGGGIEWEATPDDLELVGEQRPRGAQEDARPSR
ncbi:hypothetical protein GCM10010440_76550 [Kitasatospora cinereorecta]